MRRVLAVALAALGIACGGSETVSDAGADVAIDTPKDTALDVAPDTSGPLACGTTTCEGTDLCIYPCCGGAAPQCVPFLDGGTCPAGYASSSQCYNLGGSTQGCMPLPCTPAPPYCAPATSGDCQSWDQLSGRNCHQMCA